MPAKTAQPASQPKNTATGPKAPVKNFRLGRIKAAVWENDADQKKFFNVTFAEPTWRKPGTSTTPTVTVGMTSR